MIPSLGNYFRNPNVIIADRNDAQNYKILTIVEIKLELSLDEPVSYSLRVSCP